MISYKLAKQLKEAGFPQELKWGDFMYDKIGKGKNSVVLYSVQQEAEPIGTAIKIPTLSELIEACREGFEALNRISGEVKIGKEIIRNGFGCSRYDERIDDDVGVSFGKSPEEAVAKLWLKLSGTVAE